MVFDAMHCFDMGVFKQLGSLWFDSSFHDKPWYIGTPKIIAAIDLALLEIIPPSNIVRIAQSLNQKALWKSSEWRSFFVFYAPYILKYLMKAKYYKHFCKVSQACFLLNQSFVSNEDIFEADRLLNEFVNEFQLLYGIRNMSFNLHQLLHCTDCVSRWGPLWVYSAYDFENLNGKLLQMYNGTRFVDLQIVKKFLKIQLLKSELVQHMDNSNFYSKFGKLIRRILGNGIPTKKIFRTDKCVFIGNGKPFTIDNETMQLLSDLDSNKLPFNPEAHRFKKGIIKQNIYSTSNYKPLSQKQNCYLKTRNGEILKIIEMVGVESYVNSGIMAIFIGIKFRHKELFFKNKCRLIELEPEGKRIAFYPTEIISKCVVLKSNCNVVLSVLPNLFERD